MSSCIIEGIEYIIEDTEKIQKQIENDTQFAQMYVQQNMGNLEFQPVQDTNAASTSKDVFVWNRSTILLFIEEYRKRLIKFRDPKLRKRDLWGEIKTVFLKYNYSVTEDILDKKFRNLKKTYVHIYDNNKKSSTGRGRVTWEYYDIFEEIFAQDKTVHTDYITSSMERPEKNIYKRNKTDNNKDTTQTSHNKQDHNLVEAAQSTVNFVCTPSTSYLEDNYTQSLRATDETLLTPSTAYLEHNYTLTTENLQSLSCTPQRIKKLKRQKLDKYRDDVLNLEKKRFEELALLRKAIEESNKIQKERNSYLGQLVDIFKKK